MYALTPQILCETNLCKSVVTQCELSDRNVSSSELANAEQTGDRKLRESGQSEDELPESEQDADAELRECDQPDAELTDRDDAFCHSDPVLRVTPKGNMDQWKAIECLL